MYEEKPAAGTQDSKNMALLIWIGTIFLSFLPGLIVYLVKRDDAFVLDQGKEALNWSITVMIGYCAAWILTIVLVGPLVASAIWLGNLIVCIMGAISCSRGDAYRAPFALRLIK
jgi:uncharacterized Tic20 family protein